MAEQQPADTLVQQAHDARKLGHRPELCREDIEIELDDLGGTVQVVVLIEYLIAEMEMGDVRSDERNVTGKEFTHAIPDETFSEALGNGHKFVFGMVVPIGRKVFEDEILLRE